MISQLDVIDLNGLDVDVGQAKAWANLNGEGAIALRGSLNVASVTDYGTGEFISNCTSVFAGDGSNLIPT